MPKRNDINKILIIGSGPIVIGQACEFDYSGTQACKVLREEGYKVILINSNPATIMTDFEIANITYIEPITFEVISKIIEKELPDAILPTLGGQIALNAVLLLFNKGILKKFGVEVIGANLDSIEKAESRSIFKKSMNNIDLKVAKSEIASTLDEARTLAKNIGFPLVIRASFTMGGLGSTIVSNIYDLDKSAILALKNSPVSQIILEESLVGWKEYELELMRDSNNNVVIVCSIENVDPIGIHTGDSITVAPIQTLTDKEYQTLRDSAIKIIREIGVNTGGANVQFAVNPKTGEMVVVEMNPRVSRSSALASKATGFPIAKIAAKLAVGYTLDEIKNDITGMTMACFEPSIDYCVVKIPVWDNNRFHTSDNFLTTSMKSVGESMAIGRTFKEALQKAIRSSESELDGFSIDRSVTKNTKAYTKENILANLAYPTPKRLFHIYNAFCFNMSVYDISTITQIDPWFIFQLYQIFKTRIFCNKLMSTKKKFGNLKEQKKYYKDILTRMKSTGFSDIQIAYFLGLEESNISNIRKIIGITPVYKSVDTCAAEFCAKTPYYYSTYESECEIVSKKYEKKVIILGSGPNRIGQGIEFDYCCVHASLALHEEGVKSIIINNNPSTVSTDYDVSDRLYFEPLTYEDVMNVIHKENPYGIIVQFGGQISLNLSKSLARNGITILGTKSENIDRAENRGLFKNGMDQLGLKSPRSIAANSIEQAVNAAKFIGYPVILRPSFILGGKSIEIVYNRKSLVFFMNKVASYSYPILVDEFLQDAIEVDVDLISDGYISVICGIMEHVEEAGIHSGDSTCILPPFNIDERMIDRIITISKYVTLKLGIIGLMNIQYAIKNDELYILEVNPRASRTTPFVSKATGIPIVNFATKIMLGKSLSQLGFTKEVTLKHVSVKKSVFPFNRFLNSDNFLGPSMKSTGEVMGIGSSLTSAYVKAQLAADQRLPLSGTVFISFCKDRKDLISKLVRKFKRFKFNVIVEKNEFKFSPHRFIISAIEDKKIQIIVILDSINSKHGYNFKRAISKAVLKNRVLKITTIVGAFMICDSIEFLINKEKIEVKSLQDYHN